MIWVLLTIVFVDVCFAVILVDRYYRQGKPIERLKRYFIWEEEKKGHRIKLDRTNVKRFMRSLGNAFVKLFVLERLRVRLEKDLEKADLPVRAEELMLISFVVMSGSYLILILLTKELLLSWLVIPAIVLILRMIVKTRIEKRLQVINEQLGDALDMMASSLRAGYSFNQALDTVGREMPRPINEEFQKVTKEMSYGISIDTSLKKMLERLPLDDLELVITAVVIQRQIGGNLAEILDNISGTIRERIRLKGEVRALTAQGKISGAIASLAPVFFAVFMFFNSPEHIKVLFSDDLGQRLVLLAVVGQVLGIICVRRIIDIKF